jgi:hypothetical protein
MSERNLYKYREVMRLGCQDLLDLVAAHQMSLHRAWLEATGRPRGHRRAFGFGTHGQRQATNKKRSWWP